MEPANKNGIAEKKTGREVNFHLIDKREFESRAKKSFFYKDITKDYIWLVGNEDDFKELIK